MPKKGNESMDTAPEDTISLKNKPPKSKPCDPIKDATVASQNSGNKSEIPPSWIIWSATSYAVVMLVIGLPLWWKTTAVQRAYLPYDQMLNAKNIMHEAYKLELDVNLYGFAKDSELEPAFTAFHEGHREVKIRHTLTAVPANRMDALYKTHDLLDADAKLCEHDRNMPNAMNLYYVGRADLLKKYGKRIIFGNCRSAYYISNSSKVKLELLFDFLEKLAPMSFNLGGEEQVSDKLQLPLSLGYDFLFTLIVPEPEVQDYAWNMELGRTRFKQAFDFLEYFPLLFGKLEELAAISIRSQYLYYVKLNVQPRFNKEKQIHEVPSDQLPLVINPVESKLTSFVSQNTLLNFLVYASPCSQNPMQILDENQQPLASNAFLVPQWGGIQIYNAACPNVKANASTPHLAHQVSFSHVFSVVSIQLRELFGVPHVDPDVALELRSSVFRDWEIDLFARKRLNKLLYTAANTLQSLGQLLDQITNIVVTDEVGEEVHKSTESLMAAINAASKGQLLVALRHATEAYRASETAFHHPSNLAQLYFPDDQKYAIYIPLFLPIGIPVLVSLRTIANYVFRKKAKVD